MPLGIVDKMLGRLHPQAGIDSNSMLTLVKLSGSAQFEDRSLLWTCCNILPSKVTEHFRPKQLERLGVCIYPAMCDVVTNLENVCLLCTERTVSQMLEKGLREKLSFALKKMFSYFQKNYAVDNEVQRLWSIPCIMIGDEHFVPPKQVVLNTEYEIRPYLYQLPL